MQTGYFESFPQKRVGLYQKYFRFLKILKLLLTFVSGGVSVNVVDDGDMRHHSKKVTIERVVVVVF